MTSENRYAFSHKAKKTLVISLIVGVVLTTIGYFMVSMGQHEEGHGDPHSTKIVADSHNEESYQNGHATASDDNNHEVSTKKHGDFHPMTRVFANLWINNVFFGGLAIIGVFFFAVQYASQASWSVGIKRIPLAFGSWLPVAFVTMLTVFLVGGHDIFHWTHTDLYHEGTAHFDAILNGKKGYFFWPLQEHPSVPVFWLARLIIFFGIWYLLFRKLKKLSFQEDLEGGTQKWYQMRKLSAIFLVFFAISSSISAWDWIMSIDTHWFSTMFGWYVFASWWVAGLALTLLIVIGLKDKGLLSIVNENHIHDLGKFVFAFSIFWMYIWFSQFLLIYYAHLPEETVYFVERWKNNDYAPVFYINLILNFFFPFLLLMTRDSKRHTRILKIICPILVFGHWLDFYLMVTPGMLADNGGFGFLEIGLILIYVSAFLYVILRNMAKAPLFAKNHPMLQESLHHHI